MINPDVIITHYARNWQTKGESRRWRQGPTWEMPADFQVLVFPPSINRKMWTYATCGMSLQADATPIELHLFSPIQADQHVELLTVVAHYHLTGDYLDVGHTVNFGRPWLTGSSCDHGLISLPYLDGPSLEWLDVDGRQYRFLWLIPVTSSEVEFKKKYGLEALEGCFEARSFDYLDKLRKSAI